MNQRSMQYPDNPANLAKLIAAEERVPRDEIPASKAFGYSMAVHGLFLVVLVLSWNHMPVPEPVQVVLWSSSEVAEARRQSGVTASPKLAKTLSPMPVSKPRPSKPVPAKAKAAPEEKAEPNTLERMARSVRDFVDSKPDEPADIQVERAQERKKKREERRQQLQEREEARLREREEREREKELAKKTPKPIEKAVAKAEPKPKPRPMPAEHEEPDAKADWIERQLERKLAAQEAAAARRAEERAEALAERAAEAGEGKAGAARGGGSGNDCSALGNYCNKVNSKVRGNVDWPDEETVPTMAIFQVTMLPNGEIEDINLKQSSGNRTYDAVVERAIRESSPFPRLESGGAAQRRLILRFRPA